MASCEVRKSGLERKVNDAQVMVSKKWGRVNVQLFADRTSDVRLTGLSQIDPHISRPHP